jgi:hypothetical protein
VPCRVQRVTLIHIANNASPCRAMMENHVIDRAEWPLGLAFLLLTAKFCGAQLPPAKT